MIQRRSFPLYGSVVAIFAISAAVVVAFDAEFFSVHAGITQPLAVEMRGRGRTRFAKLNAVIVTFAKFVFHFARPQQVAAIAALWRRRICGELTIHTGQHGECCYDPEPNDHPPIWTHAHLDFRLLQMRTVAVSDRS
ncbi:hypothetical protein [Bradyrhizobium sp. CCBAU 53421]|uniref:hypothetical protein n=1 Tax=Bradyrhizobium sp. CCBAU 53421 TaxID=1325120 RepID=UPI00188B3EE1|nr:hypothetical protein [Bradyrhizobium sp. CCBAU 53421]QOZ33528.1 hypothetical protein XH92_19150 [Bradyrhizobium sp. CCBAU 53421]